MKKALTLICFLLAACLLLAGCPKEPEIPEIESLDGTWIYTQEEDTPIPYPKAKIEISGETLKCYTINSSYEDYIVAWYQNGQTLTLHISPGSLTATLADDRKSFTTRTGMTFIKQ